MRRTDGLPGRLASIFYYYYFFIVTFFPSCGQRHRIGLGPNRLPPHSGKGIAGKSHNIHLTGYNTKCAHIAVRPSCHMYDGVYFWMGTSWSRTGVVCQGQF